MDHKRIFVPVVIIGGDDLFSYCSVGIKGDISATNTPFRWASCTQRPQRSRGLPVAGQIFCCVGALVITGSLHHVGGYVNGKLNLEAEWVPQELPNGVCYSWI